MPSLCLVDFLLNFSPQKGLLLQALFFSLFHVVEGDDSLNGNLCNLFKHENLHLMVNAIFNETMYFNRKYTLKRENATRMSCHLKPKVHLDKK